MHRGEQNFGHATIKGRNLELTKYTKSSYKSRFERLICYVIPIYYNTLLKVIRFYIDLSSYDIVLSRLKISIFRIAFLLSWNQIINLIYQGNCFFWSKRGNDKKSSNQNKRDIILYTIMYNIILCFAFVLSLLYNKTLKYTERKAKAR